MYIYLLITHPNLGPLFKIITLSISACLIRSSFFFFISANLILHCFPINFHFFRELLEFLVSFFPVVHAQEALSVCDNSVNVSFVLHSDFQSAIPSVQLNIQLNSTVVQASSQQDLFSFRDFLLVDSECSISRRFTG